MTGAGVPPVLVPGCDSCGRPLTGDDHGRYRHRSCPPPSPPAAMTAALERARAMSGVTLTQCRTCGRYLAAPLDHVCRGDRS